MAASNLCIKCGTAWRGDTGKDPCPKGGQCEIPAARAVSRRPPKKPYTAPTVRDVPRELPEYTDTHDGQTEPSVWPPLDDEGFPF